MSNELTVMPNHDLQNVTVVATSPLGVPVVHQAALERCRQKVALLMTEEDEYRASLDTATRNRWGSRKSLQKALTATEGLRIYYAKMIDAMEQGYVLFPPVDVRVLAVRTTAEAPKARGSSWKSGVADEKPSVSERGAGEYVGPSQKVSDHGHFQGTGEEQKWKPHWVPVEHGDIAFPLMACKPRILASAEEAMALGLFDEIAMIGSPRKDPVLVGTIIDPRDKTKNSRQLFLIAWWIDTATL